jgi:hypothetical protein
VNIVTNFAWIGLEHSGDSERITLSFNPTAT